MKNVSMFSSATKAVTILCTAVRLIKLGFLLVPLLLISNTSCAITITGPNDVCPAQIGRYTISNISNTNPYQSWVYYDDYTQYPGGSPTAQNSNTGTGDYSFNIQVSNYPTTGSDHGLLIVYSSPLPGHQYGEAQSLAITRNQPAPNQVNNGLVTICNPNEQVSMSFPALGNNCNFCGLYGWTLLVSNGANGWNLQSAGQSGSNINVYSTNATVIAPSTFGQTGAISNFVRVTARYLICTNNAVPDISTVTPGFIGTPTISGAQVNSTDYSGGTAYVPSGYANLFANIQGGSSANWYITNGSGSISPSYTNATVSFSGFVRVVVQASNRCGAGSSYTYYLSTQQGYSGYRVAPNPVKDNLSILLDNKEMAGDVLQDIKLYDSNMKLRYTLTKEQLLRDFQNKDLITINVKSLPRGTYYLHTLIGDKTLKDQIVLE